MRKNLYDLRIEHNLSKTQISNMIGISVRQYDRIENGTSNGSVPAWEKLRDLLHSDNIDFILRKDVGL